MKRTLRLCLLVVLFAGAGCDTQEQQRNFADEAFSTPSGFTRTDRDGRILDDDKDDWRTAPVYVGRVLVDPAFPNPTAGQFVVVPVSVREFNAVQGRLQLVSLDDANRFALLDDIPEADTPGAYLFTFNPVFLGRRGLVRVFILDGRSELVSYGDIFVE